MKDAEILAGLRTADKGIILHVYQQYFDGILAHIQSNRGSKMDAEDIFQECLIVLFKRATDPSWQPNSSLGAYLKGVARNLWLKHLKTKGQLPQSEFKPELHQQEDTSGDILEIKAMKERLFWKHLKQLGDSCQKILRWSMDKLSGKEMAERLSSTVAYVKKRKSNCLKSLITSIEGDAGYSGLFD